VALVLAMSCVKHATNDTNISVGMKEMSVVEAQGALQKTITSLLG
jgi:hypothetical protein